MFAANYYEPARHDYSPVQHDSSETPAKRPRHSASPPRTARLLSRRYALTATSFKYLEIGISVGTDSATVELILGDNRGTQIVFPYATWTTMLERRAAIQRLLDLSPYSPLWIRGMAIQVYTFNGSNVFKLALADHYIYLQPATLDFMFTLENCIDHMYASLTKQLDIVTTTLHTFVNVLREKNIADAYNAKKAIRESFDVESIVDCELLAHAIPNILYIATK